MATDEDYITEAIELAREAASDGSDPFGSLLVIDDTVIKRAKNTTVTENDITAHPELKLARWAARELSAEEREQCTMYTSTEPCAMCSTAIHYAGLDRVVYSVPLTSLVDVREETTGAIPSQEVIDRKGGSTEVAGPVRESEGIQVLESHH